MPQTFALTGEINNDPLYFTEAQTDYLKGSFGDLGKLIDDPEIIGNVVTESRSQGLCSALPPMTPHEVIGLPTHDRTLIETVIVDLIDVRGDLVELHPNGGSEPRLDTGPAGQPLGDLERPLGAQHIDVSENELPIDLVT